MAQLDKHKLGLFNKFNVTRTDGNDAIGGKHHGCEYFVLDITHDPYAKDALKAYAKACQKEYPALSSDLFRKAGEQSPRNGCLQYFMDAKAENPAYIHKKMFDDLAKGNKFEDGPFRDSFGDGYGQPYIPKRQAFGRLKSGMFVYTELE